VEIKPDKHEALYNWGIALGKLADLRQGPDRKALLKEAVEKYAMAVESKPDLHEALNNWGNALMRISYLCKGRERIETLEAATEIAKRAEDLKPGAGIYNMACAYALLGQKKNALAALKKAIESDLQYREKAAGDEDFRSLWEDKAFKAVLAT
jgi:tetratricopeptide (TPR) repeat protein